MTEQRVPQVGEAARYRGAQPVVLAFYVLDWTGG